LAGVSIQWPAIADVGMAAAMYKRTCVSRKQITEGNWLSDEMMLGLPEVKNVLKHILSSNETTATDSIVSPLVQAFHSKYHQAPRKSEFVRTKSQGIRKQEKIALVVENAIKSVANVERNKRLDHTKSLMDAGLDSLSVTELSTILRSCFNIELPSTIVFNQPSVEALVKYICGILKENQIGPKTMTNFKSNIVRKEYDVSLVVEETVKSVANISKDVDHSKSLMDAGLDSLAVAELSTILRSRFDIELPSTIVFNQPSIESLTRYIYDELTRESDDLATGYQHSLLPSSSMYEINEKRVQGEYHVITHAGQKKTTIGSRSRQTGKPRILFFPGSFTNAEVANFMIDMTSYRKLFEIVVVDGTHASGPISEYWHEMMGIKTLIKNKVYSMNGLYTAWEAGFEQKLFNFEGKEKEAIRKIEKDNFLDQTADYVTALTDYFGSFDGIIGFCAGSAAAHAMISLQKSGHRDVGLDSIKFLIVMAPWISPFLEDSLKTCLVPSLLVLGKKDHPMFLKSFDEFSGHMEGPILEFKHGGAHTYPFLDNDLKQRIFQLLDIAYHQQSQYEDSIQTKSQHTKLQETEEKLQEANNKIEELLTQMEELKKAKE